MNMSILIHINHCRRAQTHTRTRTHTNIGPSINLIICIRDVYGHVIPNMYVYNFFPHCYWRVVVEKLKMVMTGRKTGEKAMVWPQALLCDASKLNLPFALARSLTHSGCLSSSSMEFAWIFLHHPSATYSLGLFSLRFSTIYFFVEKENYSIRTTVL